MQKILLLEDEKTMGKLYKKNLEEVGHEVRLVHTVASAKRLIKTFQPTLAFIDQGIKGQALSGLDFVPILRKLLPQIKIVIFSNYSDFYSKEKAINAGADDYLVKLNNPPNVLIVYIKNLHLF